MKKKQSKNKRIGVMTQNRGTMPPPARADKARKGKGSYSRKDSKVLDIID